MEQQAGDGLTTGLMDTVISGQMMAHGGELSIFALFLQADIVVKIVMLLLILASVWTWAIIFEKSMRLRKMRRLASRFEDAFWSGGSLE